MATRKTVWARVEKAIGFMTSICDQVDITGMEMDRLKRPKLSRPEALRMLREICDVLGMDWKEFIVPLARDYERRRRELGRELGWSEEDDVVCPGCGETTTKRNAKSRESCWLKLGPDWICPICREEWKAHWETERERIIRQSKLPWGESSTK